MPGILGCGDGEGGDVDAVVAVGVAVIMSCLGDAASRSPFRRPWRRPELRSTGKKNK
jgi:hypothetical protein